MAVTLTLTGKTPGQTQFGLDTFTEHYKCDATADVVLTDPSVPEMTEFHPDYPFMFVTARHCDETGEKASVLDLTYTGCIRSADDLPALPSQQTQSDTQIQSASSSRSSGGSILTSPATIQFYSPSNVLTYVSFGGAGTDSPAAPTGNPDVITWTVGDTSYTIASLPELVSAFFSIQVLTTRQSTEIVPGQYWNNIVRSTMIYVPFIFDVPSGPFLSLYSPGDGYTIGDTLTCTVGGESAVVVLTSVGGIQGTGILAWTVSSNTFTAQHFAMFATGGTGSGGGFNVTIIP